MSDPSIDDLAQSARNRGLKLVRSRVRTPGKRRFGKVGLADASGKPVLGIDAKGPMATVDEVQEYLRDLDAKDWGASLDVAVLPRKKRSPKAGGPRRAPANDVEPQATPRREPQPKAPPEPKRPPESRPEPKLREAKGSDAPILAELIGDLGHEIDKKAVQKNLKALKKADEMPLVAILGKRVVGLCAVHRTITVHREAPIGRITILVVAKDAQDQGIGRLLVEGAEKWCRKRGCRLIEVTSNDRLAQAHAFYRHMGFERSSIRFFKTL